MHRTSIPELRRVQSVQSVDDVGAHEKKANPQFRSSPKSSPACICLHLQNFTDAKRPLSRKWIARAMCAEWCRRPMSQWWNVYQLNPRFMGHKCGQKNTKQHSHFIYLHLTLCRAQESFRGTTDDCPSRWQTCSTMHQYMHPLSLTGCIEFSSGSIPSEMVAIELRLDRILEKACCGALGMPDATGSLREPNSVVKLDMQRRENGWLSIYRWITIDPNRSQQIAMDPARSQ